jgi:ABC-type phosphate transport system permease subunit
MQTVMSILPLDVVGFFALVCVFMAMTGLGAGMNPARLNLSRADRWRVGAAVTIALVAVPIVTLLLAKALRTTPEFWLNAQMAIDLWHAQAELKDERLSRRKSA